MGIGEVGPFLAVEGHSITRWSAEHEEQACRKRQKAVGATHRPLFHDAHTIGEAELLLPSVTRSLRGAVAAEDTFEADPAV